MELPFIDRDLELDRLQRLLSKRGSSLAVIHGRRRLGKSRLLRQAVGQRPAVYYVGDARESTLQRQALARDMATLLPGFDSVQYPEWEALLARWWKEAGRGWTLILDEFPALVSEAPEIPSLLQKLLDSRRGPHLVLSGSSQRLMQGLVLDRTAPLFGRAREILRIGPLPAGWISRALPLKPVAAVEAWSVWGGVPRYWELAAEYESTDEAVRELVLDPLGVLHGEPATLLLDDVRDSVQSLSILEVIGQGCHRPSEMGARLGKPSTSLARPLQRLMELQYVRRDYPYGTSARDSKRSLYRLADPFLRFWFRYVSANRSRLEFRHIEAVEALVQATRSEHTAWAWEDLARESLPRMHLFDTDWNVPGAWWGPGVDGSPLEIDVVSQSLDRKAWLVGAVKWEQHTDVSRVLAELKRQAARLPLVQGCPIHYAVWVKASGRRLESVVDCQKVLSVLL